MAYDFHPVQRPGRRVTRYEAPSSIEGALELLDEYGERARPIAGGTDLLIELDAGTRPGIDALVDLTRIGGLDRIQVEPGLVRLGALVTHNQVVASPVCLTDLTPLAQACFEVGSPQLRNRATIAGNLATASPANDTISALLALGATVELRSRAGTRQLRVDELITGLRTTAIRPGELITEIRVPRLGADQRGIFVKLGLRRAQAISVVHLAATITLDGDVVAGATLAVGSVAPTVIEVAAAAAALTGRRLEPEAIEAAAAAVGDAISPIDDLRAPASYRTQLATAMTRRALTALAAGEQLATWPADPPLLWGRTFDGRFPTGDRYRATLGESDTVAATVNGRPVTGPATPSATLLDWLRDHGGAKGVKEGCAEGECGACTVDLDGAAVMACLVPAGRAAGATVVTVEGLADSGGQLHPIQEAFIECGAVQCGFCTPGLLVASAKLLDERPRPTPDQVRSGLAGNLCRCTGYNAIHQAVDRAAGHGGDRPATTVPAAGGGS